MTRRVTITDIGKADDPGGSQETGRHSSSAAAVRPAKKISSAPAKTPRRAARTDDLGEAELRARLAAAEARVRELEARLAAVSDRIAWMADRLHSLVEDDR